MKKLFLFVLAGVVLASCKKDEPYQFRADENVWLNVEGVHVPKTTAKGVRKAAHRTDWTMHEIVRSEEVYMQSKNHLDQYSTYWFWQEKRDTINDRLMIHGYDILTEDGRLVYGFLGEHDILFTIGGDSHEMYWLVDKIDTIGYIPNSVMRAAQTQIEALYEQEKYDEIYELFHSAFVMRQCTGAEYKEILARGEQ